MALSFGRSSVTKRGARTRRRPRRDAAALAALARERLEGAKRELGSSERNAASLAVNASVRASDAICVAARGEHAIGDDHAEALRLLRTVPDGDRLARLLEQALTNKTEVDYDITRLKADSLKRIHRAAEELVRVAEERASSVTGSS